MERFRTLFWIIVFSAVVALGAAYLVFRLASSVIQEIAR